MLIIIMLMSYDTNSQVHWTVYLWENMVVSLFMFEFKEDFPVFFTYFFVLYVLHVYYTIMN